jgi:HSP20 family molecular chaperone IbpA
MTQAKGGTQTMKKNLAKREGDGSTAVAERTRSAVTYAPRFDIVGKDDELILFGDLPGVKKEDLEVRFDNGELTIEGKVQPRHASREFLYGEYGIGDFQRSFSISETIDSEMISAELHDGVLTLHLPKVEAAKPRKITVKGGN